MNSKEKLNHVANVREASDILIFGMRGIGKSMLIVEIRKESSAGQ